jgi:acetoin utilization deacetylase AcuC-like enzyme
MTLFYYDERFLNHDTGTHPERAARVEQVIRHLDREKLLESCTRPTWDLVSTERLARVHDRNYIRRVAEFAAHGGGRIEVDTVVSPQSFEVARLASGAAVDAVERVLKGETKNAFCLSRPPGHHAVANDAMGFCLFNHVAVAARVAIDEFDLERVLIVDWDVHHGNATQDTFWADPCVGFLSIHRWPFYPGTGDVDETGTGDGLGATRNIPVQLGTSRAEYLAKFRGALADFADRIRPQLVFVSAGFDAHRDDPVGSLGLEIEDFEVLSTAVQEIADVHASGRIVSILEGGYNPGVLAGCVEVHLQKLLAASKRA